MAVISESKRVPTSLAAVLEQDLVRTVCQPIVDLDTHEVVAYERELVVDIASTLLARVAPV